MGSRPAPFIPRRRKEIHSWRRMIDVRIVWRQSSKVTDAEVGGGNVMPKRQCKVRNLLLISIHVNENCVKVLFIKLITEQGKGKYEN